jgi:predicted transcriptional regulator
MEDRNLLVTLTADIVTAHVGSTAVAAAEVPKLIANVHAALAGLGSEPAPSAPVEAPKPAVSVRSSVKPDRIICLEDGKAVTLLKPHLSSAHDMTPNEYRARWNLPASYPMTAPDYSAMRSATAKASGLGRKGRGGKGAKAPARRARKG